MDLHTVGSILLILLVSYLLGSISFAWLICKMKGVNIFEVGSCNPGFTNVWRTQGMKTAIFVLIGDMLKGTIAAAIGASIFGEIGMLIAAITVIFGHTFSFMIHFKGGKGVATGAGVLIYVSPLTFLLCLCLVVSMCVLTKYMSVGSISAAIGCPIFLYLDHQSPLVIGVFCLCVVYIIWLHRGNIKRLMNGTENKIRSKRS